MSPKSANQILSTAAVCAVIFIAWIFAGWDGRLHWDEPGYLYTAAYLDLHTLNTGPLASNFYSSRLLHLGILNWLFSVIGLGQSAILSLQALYLVMLLGALGLGYWIVKDLVTEKAGFGPGYIAGSFAPIVLWLVGRTMPEIPGLFLTAISLFCLQRFLAPKGSWFWLVIGGLALGCVAFTRNNLVFAVSGYVIALLLIPMKGYKRIRVLAGASLMCLGSLVSFVLLMNVFGITIDNYLGGLTSALHETAPWVALFYFTSLEGGFVFLALPLAFYFGHRRDTFFMTVWFFLASLPIFVLLHDIEARYLLPNIFSLLGLAGIAGAGLRHQMISWTPVKKLILACVTSVALFGSGLMAQGLMTHEVEIQAVRKVIDRLHDRYGTSSGFTLLTPNDVSDFRYLRVAYPELPVYNVHQEPTWGENSRRADRQRRLFGNRFIESLDELSRLEGPFVYYGFNGSFPVTNLKALIEVLPIPSRLKAWLLTQISLMARRNQLEESWIWGHPLISFEGFERIQHYYFSEIRLPPS